jgi:hypothetical protein
MGARRPRRLSTPPDEAGGCGRGSGGWRRFGRGARSTGSISGAWLAGCGCRLIFPRRGGRGRERKEGRRGSPRCARRCLRRRPVRGLLWARGSSGSLASEVSEFVACEGELEQGGGEEAEGTSTSARACDRSAHPLCSHRHRHPIPSPSRARRRALHWERRLGLLARSVAVRQLHRLLRRRGPHRLILSNSPPSRIPGRPRSSTRGPRPFSPWLLLSPVPQWSSLTVRIARDLQRLATLPDGSTPSAAYVGITHARARGWILNT